MADAIRADLAVPAAFGSHRHEVKPPLRPFVYRIGGFEEPGDPVRRRELPLVGTPLILSFGAPYAVSAANDPDRPSLIRHAFVAGLHERYSTSRATGPNWSIQIDLSPIGAYRILGRPLDGLTNRVEHLGDVVGPDARQLVSDLEATAAWDRRFALIDAFLLRRLECGRDVSPGVDAAWQQLAASRGAVPIARIADRLGWSRRHLSQTFHRELGLPPKAVARQLRLAHAVHRMRSEPDLSLADIADIAVVAGYADQAHLTRDFRGLAGITPARFRHAAHGQETT